MIKIEFTEQELQALAGLLDAGVKASGLRAVKDAAVLLDKIEKAASQPQDDNVLNFEDRDASNG